MKRIRILGLAFVAIFALAALASASAFAENPEILPVPTTTKPANFTGTAGVTLLHTTLDNDIIECKRAENKGQLTSQDLGTVDITFKECKSGTTTCNTKGQAKEEVLVEGEIDLVDVLPTGTLDLGFAVKPYKDGNPTEMVVIECGLVKEILTVSRLRQRP
jgi:hypothetical protein